MAQSNEPQQTSSTHHRRSSFAGSTFADLFGAGRTRTSGTTTNNNKDSTNNPTSQFPGPITSAAVQAQRRVSLSTMGLSTSPSQSSPYRRRDSISSAYSGSIDESAVEDELGPSQAQPTTPFARRVSFGAKALRDVQTGGGGGSDRPNGDGYNWADSFRNRAERSSSIVSTGGGGGGGGGSPNPNTHVRAKSVATMQPPPASQLPKTNAPDHFQERILKGDFYMD